MSTASVFKQRKPRVTSTRTRDDQPSTTAEDVQDRKEEEEEGELGVSPMAAAMKRKKDSTSSRRKRTETKGKLSFGNDEDDVRFSLLVILSIPNSSHVVATGNINVATCIHST